MAWIWYHTGCYELLNPTLCPQSANLQIIPVPQEVPEGRFVSRRLEGFTITASSVNMFVFLLFFHLLETHRRVFLNGGAHTILLLHGIRKEGFQ